MPRPPLPPLAAFRKDVGEPRTRTVKHRKGLPIGSLKLVWAKRADGTRYRRYACLCADCRQARGHMPELEEKQPALDPALASEVGRKMNAARAVHGGGGGKPRTVLHDSEIPIGSRETILLPYKRYRCTCIDCRVVRGAKPHGGYVPPAPRSAPMTIEAIHRFAEIRKEIRERPKSAAAG